MGHRTTASALLLTWRRCHLLVCWSHLLSPPGESMRPPPSFPMCMHSAVGRSASHRLPAGSPPPKHNNRSTRPPQARGTLVGPDRRRAPGLKLGKTTSTIPPDRTSSAPRWEVVSVHRSSCLACAKSELCHGREDVSSPRRLSRQEWSAAGTFGGARAACLPGSLTRVYYC